MLWDTSVKSLADLHGLYSVSRPENHAWYLLLSSFYFFLGKKGLSFAAVLPSLSHVTLSRLSRTSELLIAHICSSVIWLSWAVAPSIGNGK